jgi:UDP-glucose 4-epimerase
VALPISTLPAAILWADRTIDAACHSPDQRVFLVAPERLPHLDIFEGFPTKDGTGVRDYIHVSDLVGAHARSDHLGWRQVAHAELWLRPWLFRARVVDTVSDHSRRLPTKQALRRLGDVRRVGRRSHQSRTDLSWRPKHDDPKEIVTSATPGAALNSVWAQRNYPRLDLAIIRPALEYGIS